ncbi:hypothetical protein [Aquibium microcysteis]|uniref:hypothetical protein n=1 Tax=Aquibium microcysteis TaxID=675281 RepID=UPI00165D1808|nr:hypothetical protein [Aquibium microcysteis]
MDSKIGLAAALAALSLAAGIETAVAVEYVVDSDVGLARIEALTSADALRDELHTLLSINPTDPMVGTITRKIILLGQVDGGPSDMFAMDVTSYASMMGPY